MKDKKGWLKPRGYAFPLQEAEVENPRDGISLAIPTSKYLYEKATRTPMETGTIR